MLQTGKKRDDIADLYNDIFEKYQQNRSRADNDLIEKPAVFARLGSVKGKRVLDLGCGLGGHSKFLVEKGAHVTGIDASFKMVEYARQHCLQGEFVVKNFEQARFPQAAFDAILASYSVQYVEDVARLFKKIAGWIKPTGTFVFSVYHPTQIDKKVEAFDYSQSKKYWFHLNAYDIDIFNWYHPIGTYYDALQRAGFHVKSLTEPCLNRKYKGFHPDQYRLPSCIIFETTRIS